MSGVGVFSLTTAAQLREKLIHDLALLAADPFNSYLGFNFFVTAEHLLDWQFPGDTNRAHRTNARKNEVLLQITSHIANGAKHFSVEGKHHQSVAGTRNQMGYFGNFFGNYFGAFFGRIGLHVSLEGDAALKFGPSISAVSLAKKVVEYWNAQPL